MTDLVNHPAHYADGWSNGAKVIDITENLNFNRGNAVKYIARAGKKDPAKELEDLQKAEFYLKREIARLQEPTATTAQRVWERMNDIPAGVSITDRDGDLWDPAGIANEVEAYDGDDVTNWAPFTEVLGE